MRTTHLSFLAFLLICSLPAGLWSQATPSLGEIARRIRAEKRKENTTASPATNTPTARPAKPDNKPAKQADKIAETDAQGFSRRMSDAKARAADANLHQIDRYEENIRALFNIEKFQKIDEIAAKARSTKARFPGGFWTIHLLYAPLMQPPGNGTDDATESEWKIHLDRLQRWVDQRPQSITARVALAGAYLSYGWKARGGGYADQVTEEGWRLFGERSEKAGKILAEAFNLPDKDPEWYLAMQRVMQAQQAGKAMQTAMFEKAIAFEPDYYYYYRMRAENLLPQWDGEEGEMALFAAQAADRIGGKRGDIIYYEIANYVNCFCDPRKEPKGMSWPRIKRGYAAVEEQDGASLVNTNKMAKFAAQVGDADFAHELFTRIGDAWDPGAWHSRKNFEGVRAWASFSEIEKTRREGIQAAEANLKTPAGRQFSAEFSKSFQTSYGDIFDACVKLAGKPSLTPFDLFMRIGKTGAVEQVYFSIATRVSICLSTRVSGGHFPAPPEPSYWVKVSLDPRH